MSCLARSPRLLLLDEPTAGLDPVVRDELLEALFEIVEQGECSIFYSTHILSDVSRLADELVFLVDGRILRRCSKADLTDEWRRVSFRLTGSRTTLPSTVQHRHEGDEHQVISSDFAATLERLRHLGAENVREHRMSIDEIAVQILKGDQHVAGS